MPLVGHLTARSRWSALRGGAAPLVALAAVLAVLVASAPGDPAARHLEAAPASFADPVPPTTLSAAPLDTRVDLSWPASTENQTAGYSVVYGPVGGSTTAVTVTGTSYTASGLVNGTIYRFDVHTITATSGLLGIGSQTNTGTTPVTQTATPVAAAPTGLTAAPADRRADLSWTAPADPNAASYRVLRDGVVVATVTAPTRTYADTGLVNGTSHTWTVRAVYSSSNNVSADSGPVTATPKDGSAPGAPTGLVATRGDTSVALSWAANPEYDVKAYQVRRDGAVVATVTAPTRTYTDTGLVNDRTYSYTLTATDTSGNTSPVSAPAVPATPTDLTPPAVPTGLTATRGDGRVALAWTSNPEPDLASYRVLRDGAEVATVPAGTTAFTDTGLVNDRAYAYRLVAVDTHDNRSAASDPAVSATPTDLTPPAVPTGLAAVSGDGSVVLTWTANTEPDLDGYDLFRDGVRVQGAVLGADATSITDTGLANDRTYSYTLRARDRSGNTSTSSAPVTATPTDLTAPAVPARPSAVAGDGVASLTWTPNGEEDLASYRVLRDGVVIATVTAPATTYTDTGLVNGTTYGYALQAVDTHGNASPPSAPPVTATPSDQTPPAVPSGLVAAAGDGEVALTWTASTEADLASYTVLRDGVVIATVTAPATTCTDTGLVNGTTYRYTLAARDSAGNGSLPSSPAVSATPTDLTPPAAPSGVASTAGDGVVETTWQPNTEPDLASYRVYRDGSLIATVPAPATTYSDTSATNGVTRTYEVSAVDAAGNESARSAGGPTTAVDTTAPAAPTALTAVGGDRQVALSWTAPADSDVVSYRVLRDGTEVGTADAPATTFTDAGLPNGAPHSYAVVAVDAAGNRSPASGTATATPRDTVAPGAPTSVTGTSGNGSATLRWTAPADTDLATYRVLRADGTVAATVTAPATSAVVTGLANGSPVTFTVVAVDTSGNTSAASAPVTTTPAAPSAAVPSQGSGQSGALAVSADGRWLVVATSAALETSDTNGASELYRVDTTGATAPRRLLPIGTGGATTDTQASDAALSADGRYVVVSTTARLVSADTNNLADVYRLDLATSPATAVLVSVPGSASGSRAGTVSSSQAGTVLQGTAGISARAPGLAVSADGRRVLFYSERTDLVAGESTSATVGVFAKDLVGTTPSTGPVARVSTATGGGGLPRTPTGPALDVTPDGRFAVFTATSSAGPLVVYRKDLGTGASASSAGELVVASSSAPVGGRQVEVGALRDTGQVSVSQDGRYVAFVSTSRVTTSTPTATASTSSAYRKDLSTGAVVALGDPSSQVAEVQVALSADGATGAVTTAAPLVSADRNGRADVYVRTADGAAPVLASSDGSGAPVAGGTGAVTAAEHGRIAVRGGQVFMATQLPLDPADTNAVRDLYLKDLSSGRVAAVVVR